MLVSDIKSGVLDPAARRRIARRADGWLPVHRPGTRPFDLEKTITAPLARLRLLAEENGRDPKSLATVLRVYPVAAATVEECADTMRRAEQDTETGQGSDASARGAVLAGEVGPGCGDLLGSHVLDGRAGARAAPDPDDSSVGDQDAPRTGGSHDPRDGRDDRR